MTLKFKTPRKGQPPPYVNTLLYGPPGVSKSTAACSIPGGMIYVNGDTPNALHYAFSQHNQDGRIREVDLSEGPMQVLTDVVHALQQQMELPAEKRLVETVVVDPLGELHRRMLEEASSRAVRPTLQQYGDVGTHLERFCRMLCELPFHVVFVCHEQAVKDEGSGEFERLPATGTSNPALGAKLMGAVDVVAYCGVVQQEGRNVYMGQLISAKGRRGKDRFDVLGDSRRLDLSEWIDTIHGSSRKSNDQPDEAPAQEAVA